MSAKHTPGPWRITAQGKHVVSVEDGRICAAPEHMAKWNWDANARLIAAAPELLEALELIANTDPVEAALDPQRAVRVARAAIAKAEGQQ